MLQKHQVHGKLVDKVISLAVQGSAQKSRAQCIVFSINASEIFFAFQIAMLKFATWGHDSSVNKERVLEWSDVRRAYFFVSFAVLCGA